jgi:LysR family positive regulator for ilvC
MEAFVVLARTLHFAKAAARVHTSPSGLSRLLGRLEEELGVRLLERDTRRVTITAEGLAFLDFARESLKRRDALQATLDSGEGVLRGKLRVYASVTACYTILPPLAEALRAAHPELRLSVETGDPAGAESAVREDSADLAIAALPPDGYSELASFSVRRTPMVLVASARGPFGALDLDRHGDRAQPSAADALHALRLKKVLGSVPLILPAVGLAREHFDRWSRKRSLKAHVAVETAGNEALLALAHLGIGLGLVPLMVLESGPFAEGLVIYDAGPDFCDYDIGYILRSPRPGSGACNRVTAAVTEILERIYPQGVWKK